MSAADCSLCCAGCSTAPVARVHLARVCPGRLLSHLPHPHLQHLQALTLSAARFCCSLCHGITALMPRVFILKAHQIRLFLRMMKSLLSWGKPLICACTRKTAFFPTGTWSLLFRPVLLHSDRTHGGGAVVAAQYQYHPGTLSGVFSMKVFTALPSRDKRGARSCHALRGRALVSFSCRTRFPGGPMRALPLARARTEAHLHLFGLYFLTLKLALPS